MKNKLQEVFILLAWVTIASLIIVVLATTSGGAPAPFRAKKELTTKEKLVKSNTLHWGGIKYRMELGSRGEYRTISNSGVMWVGTWSLVGNIFRLTESTTPEDASSWVSYKCKVSPDLGGSVLESHHGAESEDGSWNEGAFKIKFTREK